MRIQIGLTKEKYKIGKFGLLAPQMKYLLISMVFSHFWVKLSSKVTDGPLVTGVG